MACLEPSTGGIIAALEGQVKERDAEIYRLRRQFQLLQSYNNRRLRGDHVEGADGKLRECCPCVEEMREYANDALMIKPEWLRKDWP